MSASSWKTSVASVQISEVLVEGSLVIVVDEGSLAIVVVNCKEK